MNMSRHLIGAILSIALAVPVLAQSTADTSAVMAANQSFYAAVSARNLEAQERLWVRDSYVTSASRRIAAHVGHAP
jgi:hypothetical protein